MEFSTLCVHGSELRVDATGSVVVPIFQTATFAHPGFGQSTGYDYSRSQNPTRQYLEQTMANLEAGAEALAFSTGMAAIATLLELFSPGDHLITSSDLYGGVHRLLAEVGLKNGISTTSADSLADVAQAIRNTTKAILVETPSNPMMNIADIAGLAELAHDHGLLLIVDNTFLTPYFQRPLTLGADIVVHSGTKFLGGHNDVMAGFLVVADPAIAERLRFLHKTIGSVLSPFESWLIIRGLKTLPVRLQAQQRSARAIAAWLAAHDAVDKVYYPGLDDHPDAALARRQATGSGAMISFSVASEELARTVLGSVRLIQFAESLGGTETLITYPAVQTHADIPAADREAKGITNRLLRLSVGLESEVDLIADLAAALGSS